MDKILMLRKEGHMGARGIYIGMRRQAPELGPIRYTYAWPARDRTSLVIRIECSHLALRIRDNTCIKRGVVLRLGLCLLFVLIRVV